MLLSLVSLLYVVQAVHAHCLPPDNIPNGQVSYPRSLANNSTATYTCNSGYVMTTGDAIRVCQYYYYTGTKPRCTDMDECALDVHTCDANAECTNTDGSYSCACNTGYSGDGVTCSDMDECTLVHTCDANAVCTNTDGSYSCACNTGYSGDGVTCSADSICAGDYSDVSCYCDGANCPAQIDATLCGCPNGYSDNFVLIPGKYLYIEGISFQTETGTYDYLYESTPNECKAYCIATEGCVSFTFGTSEGYCQLNNRTPITEPFFDYETAEYYARNCRCV